MIATLAVSLLLMPCIFAYLVLVVPANYVVTLVAGAPPQQLPHCPVRRGAGSRAAQPACAPAGRNTGDFGAVAVPARPGPVLR